MANGSPSRYICRFSFSHACPLEGRKFQAAATGGTPVPSAMTATHRLAVGRISLTRLSFCHKPKAWPVFPWPGSSCCPVWYLSFATTPVPTPVRRGTSVVSHPHDHTSATVHSNQYVDGWDVSAAVASAFAAVVVAGASVSLGVYDAMPPLFSLTLADTDLARFPCPAHALRVEWLHRSHVVHGSITTVWHTRLPRHAMNSALGLGHVVVARLRAALMGSGEGEGDKHGGLPSRQTSVIGSTLSTAVQKGNLIPMCSLPHVVPP
ncbi:hypothetical protein B0T22DRAFT_35636 [Podospora appendiculata]|uniref:Uncharacterized protein n=1 Tax=Podospora appendiculata TaxID=314037 RepID=A0AAE0XGW5_9PEZI|nr:hypothetical protein B0T22DRAFT_35636 [Podospora appendiculata]